MERVRNVLADVLVGIAIIVGALWILRGVFRFVYWGASMIVVLIVIIVILRVASKLRQ
jgi:hypothetical protein